MSLLEKYDSLYQNLKICFLAINKIFCHLICNFNRIINKYFFSILIYLYMFQLLNQKYIRTIFQIYGSKTRKSAEFLYIFINTNFKILIKKETPFLTRAVDNFFKYFLTCIVLLRIFYLTIDTKVLTGFLLAP